MLDIDPALLAFTHTPREGLVREARDYIESSQRGLSEDREAQSLPVGQRVRHALFGPGTVVEVDLDKGAHVVQFDDMPTPRRISFRARLERE